jgi:hypothetical protein
MKYMLDIEDQELWKRAKTQAAILDMSLSALIKILLELHLEVLEIPNRWEEENDKDGYRNGFINGFVWGLDVPRKDLKRALGYEYQTNDMPFSEPLFMDTLYKCKEKDDDLVESDEAYTSVWLEGFFKGIELFNEKAERLIAKKRLKQS